MSKNRRRPGLGQKGDMLTEKGLVDYRKLLMWQGSPLCGTPWVASCPRPPVLPRRAIRSIAQARFQERKILANEPGSSAEKDLRLARSAIVLTSCAGLCLLLCSLLFVQCSCCSEYDKGGNKASVNNARLCRHCPEQREGCPLLPKL